MARPQRQHEPACPFIDRDDGRCARRFTLSHMEEAFTYCLHGFSRCPIYHELTREQHEGEFEPVPQPITIFGHRVPRQADDPRPAPAPIPLRSTGT